jgi:hypothetical protein
MRRLLPGPEAPKWTELAAVAAALPNGMVLLRRLAAAPDIESLRDSLAELQYALVFRSIGCEVSWEPDGSAGPDLAVSVGGDAFAVEVARFRPINDGPSPAGELLEPYGNPERDIAKSITKISDKFRQVGDRRGIIALWNDDEALEDLEVEIAARELRDSAQLPAGLVGVVYGSKWIGRQQLFWFPFAKEANLTAEAIGERLSRVSVSDALSGHMEGSDVLRRVDLE